MCDSYMHCEEQLRLTRRCLELIDAYGFGVAIQTKSDRILRDLDLLCSINRKAKCVVQLTLTTYDEGLCKILEPKVCTTKRRVEVLNIMRENGIPTVVWLTPVLPFINDTKENISGILDLCIKAKVYGIICFGIGLTLREGNREYFYQQLDQLFPQLKEKYIQTYQNQYILESPANKDLMRFFHKTCEENGIIHDNEQIFDYLHSFEEKTECRQMSLFEFL